MINHGDFPCINMVSTWPSGKFPFDCQKIAKKWQFLAIFFNVKFLSIFWQSMTVKWQFSGGSATYARLPPTVMGLFKNNWSFISIHEPKCTMPLSGNLVHFCPKLNCIKLIVTSPSLDPFAAILIKYVLLLRSLLKSTPDPPENCHLTVKKFPKTWHFFQQNCHWQSAFNFSDLSTLHTICDWLL